MEGKEPEYSVLMEGRHSESWDLMEGRQGKGGHSEYKGLPGRVVRGMG